jgi:hypothetical protein
MFGRIQNNIAERLSPTREHWSGLRADIAARLRHFRRGRDADLQTAVEQDFTLLLEAWGIENEADIPGILRDLRLRCLLLALPMVLALATALLAPGLYSGLTLALIAPPCLFGLLTTRWRMSILHNRAFTPLHRWLIAGGGSFFNAHGGTKFHAHRHRYIKKRSE